MALQTQRIYTNYMNKTAFYLDWSEEWISDGASNYSNISWRVGVHASGGYATWYSNAIKILSANLGGNGLTTGTWSNITINDGADVQLGNGGFNYGHDSAGNAGIGGSIQGWLYANGNSTTASGSWGLTHINRYAVITGTQGSFTDEATNVYISYSNPGGGSVTADLFVRRLGSSGGFTLIASRSSYANGANFSLTAGELNSAFSTLTSSKQGQVLMRVTNSVGATDLGWGNEITLTVINANPTFTSYTYKDNNAAMVTLTGSDQVIVQNPGGLTNQTSNLLVTITAANKAVALKQATLVDYLFTIGTFSASGTYSSSADVTKTIGGVDLAGSQTLQVAARDSRTNSTQVNTNIVVVPYTVPVVAAHLSRSNNFDAAVHLDFDLLQISSITVGGVDKNSIKSGATSTANRIEYRFKTDAGAYGAWIDRSAIVSAGADGVSTVTTTGLDLVASPTENHTYTADVRITDKLGNSTTLTVYLASGKPIFRIGIDRMLYHNELAFNSINSITSNATLTPIGSAALNLFYVTALATAATIAAPSGTPTNGNRLLLRIKGDATPRTLTWNAIYRVIGSTLPTTTVASKTFYIGIIYNSTDTKWDVIAISKEA